MKKFRKRVFPLHLASKDIPQELDEELLETEEEDGEYGEKKHLFWRFYWGGPSPREDDLLDGI